MNPQILYFRINNYCNAKCFMCDFWKNPHKDFDKGIFEQVINSLPMIKLVRFTGGEPLLCSNLSYYAKICNDRGILTSIITNGLLLEKKIDELANQGINQIIISLDASTPKLHDKLRGTPGLFSKIEAAVKLINKKYPFIKIRINTVVSHDNIYDLTNIFNWLKEHGISQWSIIPIKLPDYKWSDKISFEAFQSVYQNFQDTVKDCDILMGYSANWANDIKAFWNGEGTIRPKGKCNLGEKVTFYDPFSDIFFPCNCIPHRKQKLCNYSAMANWYYEHGPSHCNGCEPLNAWYSDNIESTDFNIFRF